MGWVMAYDLNTGTIKWKHLSAKTLKHRRQAINYRRSEWIAEKGIVVTSTGIFVLQW
jgi:hypothetical protein